LYLPEGNEEFDLEEIRQGILAGRGDEIAAQEDTKLLSIIEIGKMVAEVLLNMTWQTICSGEHESFLISDDPVIAHAFDQRSNKVHLRMGVATPGVNVWFPLCRTICLRIVKGEESGLGQCVSAGVRYVNKMMIMCAERWVYASERSEKIKSLMDKKGSQVSVKTVDFRFEGQKY
jgi:Protein of unknown function (DUF4238)